MRFEDDRYRTSPDVVGRLRVLRYARAGTPTTETRTRRFAIAAAIAAGEVREVGRRRSGVVLAITKKGIDELAWLEEAFGSRVPNHAARQAERRVRGGGR